MNTLNQTSLKVVACAMVAVALTVASSWTFVASTAVVRASAQSVSMVASTDNHLAQAATTGLLQ